MSSAKFVFPKLRLAAQLKEAGGVAVADAMEAVKENLAELRPEGLSELQGIAQQATACFETFPTAFDAQAIQTLYGIASRGVGLGDLCGARAADAALVSLCDLLDHLSASGRWDRDAVGVHVRTLQLLTASVGQQMPPAAIDQILLGLRKVTGRYSVEKAAAAG